MIKNEDNYAFIDGQNLHKSTKTNGWIIDWQKFRVYLKEKFSIKKAYIFLGYLKNNHNFYKLIKDAGFKIIFKEILIDKNGKIKGNVDAELVLNTLIKINNYDQAIIVTGDGDFSCLIKYLRSKNKLKYLLVPNEKEYSSLLKKSARDKIIFINRNKRRLELK